MEFLKSIGTLSWGVIKRLYYLLPSLLSDPFDILERWCKVIYEPPQWLFGLLLFLGATVAVILAYHEVRMQKVGLEKQLVASKQMSYSIIWGRDPDVKEEWRLVESDKDNYKSWRTVWESESEGLWFILAHYVVINTLKLIRIESINLDIGGQKFESNWKSAEFTGIDEPNVEFKIPFEVSRGDQTAKIEAVIDGKYYTSDSFTLNLPKKK
jgi:hypothetical protein